MEPIQWYFDREINTIENAEQAERFWKHCFLAGYSEMYTEELIKLKKDINTFKSTTWQ